MRGIFAFVANWILQHNGREAAERFIVENPTILLVNSK